MDFWFEIPGRPRGKERPRIVTDRATRKSHGITPKQTKEYEEWIRLQYQITYMQYPEKWTLEKVPIQIVVLQCMPIPKRATKIERTKMLQGALLPVVKPDIDNVCKAVLDALHGLAYKDDNQVVELLAFKKYVEGNGAVCVQIAPALHPSPFLHIIQKSMPSVMSERYFNTNLEMKGG